MVGSLGQRDSRGQKLWDSLFPWQSLWLQEPVVPCSERSLPEVSRGICQGPSSRSDTSDPGPCWELPCLGLMVA